MTRVKPQLPLLWNCLVLKKVIRLIYLNSDVKILNVSIPRDNTAILYRRI